MHFLRWRALEERRGAVPHHALVLARLPPLQQARDLFRLEERWNRRHPHRAGVDHLRQAHLERRQTLLQRPPRTTTPPAGYFSFFQSTSARARFTVRVRVCECSYVVGQGCGLQGVFERTPDDGTRAVSQDDRRGEGSHSRRRAETVIVDMWKRESASGM